MLSYVLYYSKLLYRSSTKFKLNLFFIYTAANNHFITLLTPHIFIPTKVLKIKFFKVTKLNFLLRLSFYFTLLYFSLAILFYFI